MITKKRDTQNWNRYRKGKVNVGTYIEPETKRRLERVAKINCASIAETLRVAILDYLAAQK